MNPYDTAPKTDTSRDTRNEQQANVELSGNFKLTPEQQAIIAKLGG